MSDNEPTMIPAAEILKRLIRAHRDRRDSANKRPGRGQQLKDEAAGLDSAIRIVNRLIDEQTEKAS